MLYYHGFQIGSNNWDLWLASITFFQVYETWIRAKQYQYMLSSNKRNSNSSFRNLETIYIR